MADEDYDELVEQAATQAGDDRARMQAAEFVERSAPYLEAAVNEERQMEERRLQALAALGVGPDDFVVDAVPIWSVGIDWEVVTKAAEEGKLRMFVYSERDPSDVREVSLGTPKVVEKGTIQFAVGSLEEEPAKVRVLDDVRFLSYGPVLDPPHEQWRIESVTEVPECWCGGPVGPREPGDEDGLGCLEHLEHIWDAPAGEAPC